MHGSPWARAYGSERCLFTLQASLKEREQSRRVAARSSCYFARRGYCNFPQPGFFPIISRNAANGFDVAAAVAFSSILPVLSM